MFRVAAPCANLFHAEVEGGDDVVATTTRTVADRLELDDLLERGVEIHARCYCGHVTFVTTANAMLLPEPDATVPPGA